MPSSRHGRRARRPPRLARPERILRLQRGDRVNRMRAADRRGRASDRPRYRTLPWRTSSAIAPTVSSIGDRRDRRDADSRDRSRRSPSRLSEASHARADVLGPAVDARDSSPSGLRTLPNFVAMTTPSRRSLMARPTSCSFVNGPYMSAVSRNVIPRSIARWIVAIDSALVARCRRTRSSPCSRGPSRTQPVHVALICVSAYTYL